MPVYMDTPVGKVPVPQGLAEPYMNMTAEEVWEALQLDLKRTGFVNPVAYAVWAQKNPVAYSVLKGLSRWENRKGGM